jgi:hypothetical protein
MHNGKTMQSIKAGDKWLSDHLDAYYRWAKANNSLLIVTFDENDKSNKRGPNRDYKGLTDPQSSDPVLQNRIATVFAGAHIKPGPYQEGKGITHVNVLRTIEAMYDLPKSGAQQENAARAGISDDFIITDVFAP